MALSVVRYFARRLFDRLRNLHAPWQESQEQEDCRICLEPFQDPRSLSCLHIYCSSCLDDYATKRLLTLVELITERVLGIITIPCPLCRLQTHKAAGTILSFPEPKTCCHCNRFIKKVVRFPGCAHVNDNQCLPCMEGFEETAGEVRCPHCIGTTCPIDILPQQYLCSNCEQFSSDDTCNECTGRLLHPDRSQQEIRNERKTDCIVTCAIIFVVLGLLYAFLSAAIYRQGQPVYGQQCYRDVVWYVDQHGIADNVVCEKVITGYRSWSVESSNKNSKRNSAKKKAEREENVERESKETSHEVKLEPVYEIECVPKRVWEVTPEGEVHTKGCKQVLLGHRKVKSVTNDGNT